MCCFVKRIRVLAKNFLWGGGGGGGGGLFIPKCFVTQRSTMSVISAKGSGALHPLPCFAMWLVSIIPETYKIFNVLKQRA